MHQFCECFHCLDSVKTLNALYLKPIVTECEESLKYGILLHLILPQLGGYKKTVFRLKQRMMRISLVLLGLIGSRLDIDCYHLLLPMICLVLWGMATHLQ